MEPLARIADTAHARIGATSNGHKQWYALDVKPRHDKIAAVALSAKGYEQFSPVHYSRHHWSDRYKLVELPLFAGYVFCRFALHDRTSVLETVGVRSVIGLGKVPVPIEDREIEALRRVAAAGASAEPFPYIEEGRPVEIVDGPLCGLRGIVVSAKQNYRLVLSVTLLRRSIAVEIDRRWLG